MEVKSNVSIVYQQDHYEAPIIHSHQPIQFENAQSWNSGKGNLNHKGKGPSWGHPPVGPNPGQGTWGPPGQIKKNKP